MGLKVHVFGMLGVALQVLESKNGIPISLAVIHAAVSWHAPAAHAVLGLCGALQQP